MRGSLTPSNQEPAARKQTFRIARNASEIVRGRKKREGQLKVLSNRSTAKTFLGRKGLRGERDRGRRGL